VVFLNCQWQPERPIRQGQVANHLIKIAKAAVLTGCNTIISGISPAIAQTIAELGIDLGAIKTTSTIESALRDSITRPGA
jgi:anti-anti-sigma regulatory factor